MIDIICEESCDFFRTIAKAAFRQLELSGNCIVELVFAEDDEMQRLNREHRGIDKSTDVLSFASIDFVDGIGKLDKKNYRLEYDPGYKAVNLGSIVINEQQAAIQAAEYGHSTERERAYLFLHGLLHIFGYDHINESDKRTMRGLEEKILNSLSLSVLIEKGN